jgi:hypothetical protein
MSLRRLGFASVLGLMLLAAPAVAQDVQIQIARGPYYVGEAFEVQVVASDFEEEPPPEISAGAIEGGRLRYVGVSPSTSTSISIINGKMSRVHEVTFVYRYELTGTREGRIQISPFTVSQTNTSISTRSFDVAIEGVPETNDVEVALELPPTSSTCPSLIHPPFVFSTSRRREAIPNSKYRQRRAYSGCLRSLRKGRSEVDRRWSFVPRGR